MSDTSPEVFEIPYHVEVGDEDREHGTMTFPFNSDRLAVSSHTMIALQQAASYSA